MNFFLKKQEEAFFFYEPAGRLMNGLISEIVYFRIHRQNVMMSTEKNWNKVAFLTVLFLLAMAHEGHAGRCIPLFNPSGGAVLVANALKKAGFPNGMVKRSREADLNSNVRNGDSVRTGDTLLLNLFAERSFKTVIDRVETDVNGTLLVRSRIPGNSSGFCLVSSRNGISQLVAEIPEKNEYYRTWTDRNSGRNYLLETDGFSGILPETEPPIVPPLPEQPGIGEGGSGNEVMSESNLKKGRTGADLNNHATPGENQRDTLTVLVVYTPAASVWAATAETDINHTISLMMARSQLVLDNNNLPLVFQLVHAAQVDYPERGIGDDLRLMTEKDDGIMDEVHLLRDAWCADLVVLLELTEESAGTSWILNSAKGMPEYAFSVIRVQQASGSYAAIHEIGHNMGCHHHKQQNYQPGPGLFPYSAGWRWSGTGNRKYCTIMSYDKGTWFPDGVDAIRMPFFSDPGILYEGGAAGDSADADNDRTIREISPVITSYRGGCLQCGPPSEQATGLIATVTGENSVILEWKRGSGNAVLVVAGEMPGATCIPVRGKRYTPDRIFGKGDETGYGNYAVYNGQGTTATVTGLKPGTSYHINIYEYDSGSVCYLVPPLTGNFTTPGKPPQGQVSVWEWQNPRPQGNPLCNVQMVNARDGWAVGECGTIIRTRDGGDTWTLQKSGTSQALLDLCFTDTLNGAVVGNTGVILTTLDGGGTWISRFSGTVSALFGISCSDRKNGLAVGASGTILRTTDGGITWTSQKSGTTLPLLDVSCPASGMGYAVGFSGTILKTTDGGFTWTKLPAVTGNRLSGVSFPAADTGTVIGTGGIILRTNDGGKNWIRQTSGTTADLAGISFCDPKHGFATGKAGNNLFLLKTSLGGEKWELHPIPSDSYLTGISFANPGQGTIVGGSSSGTGVTSLIYTTHDSAVSWNLESEVATDRFLNDVVFTDRENGIAVGEDGAIVTTMDSGMTWNRRESGSTASFCQIFPVDSVTWMAVGTDNSASAGVLSRSDDHGLTWTTQPFLPSKTGSSLTGVHFLSRSTGFLVGGMKSGTAPETGTSEEPLLLKTDDGGTKWERIPIGINGKLTGIGFCTSQRGFAPGNRKGTGSSSQVEGFILGTSDGGKTWHVLVEGFGKELGKITFANDHTGVILTSGPVIIVTSDGGKTWREKPTGITDVQLKDVFLHDDLHWMAAGTNGTVCMTADGGLSWEREESGTRLGLGAVFFVDAGNGFLAGQGGTILRKSGEPCFYPSVAGAVTGPDHVCRGSSNVLFSIDPVLHATSYTWSYSGTGVAIGKGASNVIDIGFSLDATSGVLTVSGKNQCGSGAPSSHPVMVNPVFQITEEVTICPGEAYHGITLPGTWSRNFRSSGGCDSTMVTILSNHPVIIPGVVVRGDTLGSVDAFTAYQWLDENGPVEGASDRRYVISQTGSYRLAVTDSNGCRQLSGIVDVVVTKADRLGRGEARFSIVPNPNNGRFAIHAGNTLTGMVTIRLMNPSGQPVAMETVRSSGTTGRWEYDFSYLHKGIYLLVISAGELQTCKKIVIL